MNRRTALTMISAGTAVWGAGCLSSEKAGPIDFELLNFTEIVHQADTTITDEDENYVLEETYEIEKQQDMARVIQEEGFTEATNGEVFDILVVLSAGASEEGEFQVTCNESDRTSDVFLAEIRETHDRDNTYVEFQQSICSGGL